MAFRYTRPPLTENIVSVVALAACAWWLSVDSSAQTWQRYVDWSPPWFRFVGAVFLIHAAVFWGMAAFFGSVERTGKPDFIARYRIQTKTHKRPSASRVAFVLAVNQFVWTPLTLIGIWQALQLRGWDDIESLPSVGRFFAMMAGLTVCSTTWFYFSHRLLHRPWWMRKVHRVHHEFRTSTALAAEYAHWFEFIVGNFGTMAVGVILLAPSLFTIYVYTLLGTFTFVAHHCGFAVPWISSPVHHDWHHYRYIEAFGTYNIWDRLLGTDTEYKTLKHGDEVK